MTTKKRIRPNRASKNTAPRYVSRPHAVPTPEEATEQSWIVFALGLFVLLGIGFISAICYIVFIG